jgi:hypothetical protein
VRCLSLQGRGREPGTRQTPVGNVLLSSTWPIKLFKPFD